MWRVACLLVVFGFAVFACGGDDARPKTKPVDAKAAQQWLDTVVTPKLTATGEIDPALYPKTPILENDANPPVNTAAVAMVFRHVNQEHATVRGGKITSPPLGLAEYDIVFPNGVSNRLKMFLEPANTKGAFRIGQLFYVHLTPQCAEPTYLYAQPPFEQSNTTSCINPAVTSVPVTSVR